MKKTFITIAVCLFLVNIACSQQEDLQMKIFKINHANIITIAELADNLKSDAGKVTFDANTNSLIVVDNPVSLMRIESVIQELDVKQKQVEINVIVAEATDSSWQKLGIESASLVIPNADFKAILQLMDSDKNIHKRSNMTVRTLSGQPAQLQVSKDEIIGEEKIIYSSGQEITNTVRRPLGDFLEVLPRVNNDNTILIIIRPLSSNLNKEGDPEEKTVLTQVVINNRDTIMLGGVSKVQVKSESSSLPGLDIPIFKEKGKEDHRVVMFLTTRIID